MTLGPFWTFWFLKKIASKIFNFKFPKINFEVSFLLNVYPLFNEYFTSGTYSSDDSIKTF